MLTLKTFTTLVLSIGTVSLLLGCGNGGSGTSQGGNNPNGNLANKKVYSNDCHYSLLVNLNSIYTLHKEYEYYRIKKAESLIGSYHQMENTLALYSPISCQLPEKIVQEANLKTGALDDDEIKGFLDQMMNEGLLEYHQCQNSTYAKNDREKYQCQLITKFVKENGWIH